MIRTIIFFCLLSIAYTPVAWANEGAGLISSDLDGAFPKALWRGQYRSEINYLLKNLPANSNLKSVQEIKRNMLVSYYDTSLIKNDTGTKDDGNDLLTLRLQKLVQMGLWDDAFKLYTTTTEDPGQNNQLAQTGLLLIMFQKGLPTACLEEKVLAPRFPDITFWKQIDGVCNAEISGNSTIGTQFPESSVLNALYSEPAFKISANDVTALNKLTPLELALLSIKKRIDYKDFQLSNKTPPHITKTFLMDTNFPKIHKESLDQLAIQQALLPESPMSETLKSYEKDVQSLSQEQLISLISTKLKAGIKITEKELEKLINLAPDNPKNYFYAQILNEIKAVEKEQSISEANFSAGLQAFEAKYTKKVNLLKSLLDKPAEFSNNPVEVYEKQVSLTPGGHYVMSTSDLTGWLETTQQHRLSGLSLLIILSNNEIDALAENSGDIQKKNTVNVLKSLSTVGLIDQAHHIAKEKLANLMGVI